MSTRRELNQRSVLTIQQVLNVELWTPETGVIVTPTDKIWTRRWIMTPTYALSSYYRFNRLLLFSVYCLQFLDVSGLKDSES